MVLQVLHMTFRYFMCTVNVHVLCIVINWVNCTHTVYRRRFGSMWLLTHCFLSSQAREAVIWELEQRHLQEKYHLFKQQVKEQYSLQRQQLTKRHNKVNYAATSKSIIFFVFLYVILTVFCGSVLSYGRTRIELLGSSKLKWRGRSHCRPRRECPSRRPKKLKQSPIWISSKRSSES